MLNLHLVMIMFFELLGPEFNTDDHILDSMKNTTGNNIHSATQVDRPPAIRGK